MIVIDIQSAGLGNCMFQYAVGKALSLKHNTELKFDMTSLDRNQMPYYPLTYEEKINYLKDSILAFNIDFQVATSSEINKLRSKYDERRLFHNKHLRKIFKYIIPKNNYYFTEGLSFSFDKKLLLFGEDVYLDGLFMNPKYFSEINKELVYDFSLKSSLSTDKLAILENINRCESVSIHIRRGDYNDINQTKNIYPIYGVGYVNSALDIINSMKKKPIFFLFSDDIEWCKINFSSLDNIYFISGNKPYEDFWLMKSCKNNIIVNSTFSWWAAWMNNNPNKTVIGPRKWRNDCKDTSGLKIENWIFIE